MHYVIYGRPLTAAAHVPDHHHHCDYDQGLDFHEDDEDIEDDAASTCDDNLLSSNATICSHIECVSF